MDNWNPLDVAWLFSYTLHFEVHRSPLYSESLVHNLVKIFLPMIAGTGYGFPTIWVQGVQNNLLQGVPKSQVLSVLKFLYMVSIKIWVQGVPIFRIQENNLQGVPKNQVQDVPKNWVQGVPKNQVQGVPKIFGYMMSKFLEICYRVSKKNCAHGVPKIGYRVSQNLCTVCPITIWVHGVPELFVYRLSQNYLGTGCPKI